MRTTKLKLLFQRILGDVNVANSIFFIVRQLVDVFVIYAFNNLALECCVSIGRISFAGKLLARIAGLFSISLPVQFSVLSHHSENGHLTSKTSVWLKHVNAWMRSFQNFTIILRTIDSEIQQVELRFSRSFLQNLILVSHYLLFFHARRHKNSCRL